MTCPSLAPKVVQAIRKTVRRSSASLHEPFFAGNEWRYVKECLDTTFVSSVGPFVDRFESQLSAFTQAEHCVAVSSGTAALHTALLLAGVKPADEVLVPALTFAATANAVAYCGAVPHFVECSDQTLGIDVDRLRAYLAAITETTDGGCKNRLTGNIIRAIVPVHVFGHVMEIESLVPLCQTLGITVIEDAAESLGSTRNGRHSGTHGLFGTLSFNGNKTVTTGGGGALLTNDETLAKRAKHLTTTAKVPHKWEYRHDVVGFNYRLTNLAAALGCAQLEQLPRFVEAKRQLFALYAEAFSDICELKLFGEPAGNRSNYWLQTLILEVDVQDYRDDILDATNRAGYQTRPAWTLIHQLAPFANSPRMELPVAESLSRRIVNIPSSAQLVLQ